MSMISPKNSAVTVAHLKALQFHLDTAGCTKDVDHTHFDKRVSESFASVWRKQVSEQIVTLREPRGAKMFDRYGFRIMTRPKSPKTNYSIRSRVFSAPSSRISRRPSRSRRYSLADGAGSLVTDRSLLHCSGHCLDSSVGRAD
jgi:hypothetical protein